MNRITSAILAAVLLFPAAVTAQEPSARERELEELVRKLAEKVDDLESRLSQLEGANSGGDTEARVELLEQSVQQIKDERPLSLNPEEWTKIKKWASDSTTLTPRWKDGLRFASDDGSINLKIGGRIHLETAFFAENGGIERRLGTEFEDGLEFRRARLYFSGTIYDDIEFKVQFDFAGGDADFKDVYLGMKDVPYLGHIRIGHFKEPFSFEQIPSSNTNVFLERSLVNTFVPRRNTGIISYNTMLDKRMTLSVGVFRQTDSFGNGQGGRDYSMTARLTGLPLYKDEGRKLLHFGVSYSHRNYQDDTVRFRARPGSNLAPHIVDTGAFSADTGDIIGLEAAWVHGPFSIQSEYVLASIQGGSQRVGEPNLWGATVQASYFLTGEHRPYNTTDGAFGRLKPLRNFGVDGGIGAWELAARLSYLNLNDGGVKGGRLRALTIGLNWHLNPTVRTMWDYVLADPSDGGSVSAFMWRFQVAF